MVDIKQFLELVKRFGEVKGLAETTVSLRLFNDTRRLRILREGGDLGVRKAEVAVRYMSDQWPAGVAWPKGIKRPEKVL